MAGEETVQSENPFMSLTDVDTVIASKLLQVNIVHRPGKQGNVLGSFNVWRKAGMFGSGDDMMKFCPVNGCMGVFDYILTLTEAEAESIADIDRPSEWPPEVQFKHDNWHNEMVRCPVCKLESPRFLLADSYGFNMDINKIAERMAQLFQTMGGDADVYLVRTKKDGMFGKAREELYSADLSYTRYNKKLASAREREKVFYPLKKIVTDASASGLVSKFKALLRA